MTEATSAKQRLAVKIVGKQGKEKSMSDNEKAIARNEVGKWLLKAYPECISVGDDYVGKIPLADVETWLRGDMPGLPQRKEKAE